MVGISPRFPTAAERIFARRQTLSQSLTIHFFKVFRSSDAEIYRVQHEQNLFGSFRPQSTLTFFDSLRPADILLGNIGYKIALFHAVGTRASSWIRRCKHPEPAPVHTCATTQLPNCFICQWTARSGMILQLHTLGKMPPPTLRGSPCFDRTFHVPLNEHARTDQ